MSEVSSKILSEKDGNQVLRSAFNDNDMTISTSGFLDAKVGHRIKYKAVSTTIDEHIYFDEVSVVIAEFTNGSTFITVPSTLNYKPGQYLMLNVGVDGIPDETVITVVQNSTTIVMSEAFTGPDGSFKLHAANQIKRLRLRYNNDNHDVLLDAARVE